MKTTILTSLGTLFVLCICLIICTPTTSVSSSVSQEKIAYTEQSLNAIAVISNSLLLPDKPDKICNNNANFIPVAIDKTTAQLVAIEKFPAKKQEISQADHPQCGNGIIQFAVTTTKGKLYYPADHPASFSTMLLKSQQVNNLACENADPKIMVSA